MSPGSTQLLPPGESSLVDSREVLRALVEKELKLKYKRSVLGFFWSLLTPVLLTGVYLFVFIYVYKVDINEFVLFLFSGLLPWQFFNQAMLAATNSLVENAALIRKVYFPRILIPVASVISNLINFIMALVLLCLAVLMTGRPLWLTIHWLLLAIVLETLLCIGVSLILSIGNVYMRDVRQVISILLMVLFFGTPIVYELSRVPDQFRPLILANPLAAIMELYRSALFTMTPPDLGVVLLGVMEVGVIFGLGYFVFRRVSPVLAKEL